MRRQRLLRQRGGDAERNRQVRAALLQPQVADHVEVHILIRQFELCLLFQHRQQQAQPAAVHTGRRAARAAERRIDQERLHLRKHGPRALDGAGHRAADRVGPGEKQPGRIDHLPHAGIAHLKHADLIGRAETILHRAQQAQPCVPVALKIQHRIHDMLQHARAGNRPILGHMPDDEHGGSVLLGISGEHGRGGAHLRHAAGRTLRFLAGHGLDGVDDQVIALLRLCLLERVFQRRVAQQQHIVLHPQPIGPELELRRAFLARNVQYAALAGEAIGRLHEQRRFADARVAAEQHHHAREQTAAGHAVQLGHARGDARGVHHRYVGKPLDAAALLRQAHRYRRFLHQRVPAAAGRALAHPSGRFIAAFSAEKNRFFLILCHRCSTPRYDPFIRSSAIPLP